MKPTSPRTRSITLAAAVVIGASALGGCSGMELAGAGTVGAIATSIFSPSGVDADYQAYLTGCANEVTAVQQLASSESSALINGLAQATDPMTKGMLMATLAFKQGSSPLIKCSLQRKRGVAEMLVDGTNLPALGVELYREQRAGARFERQLDADTKRFEATQAAETAIRTDNTSLIRDLVGTQPQRAAAEAAAIGAAAAPAAGE